MVPGSAPARAARRARSPSPTAAAKGSAPDGRPGSRPATPPARGSARAGGCRAGRGGPWPRCGPAAQPGVPSVAPKPGTSCRGRGHADGSRAAPSGADFPGRGPGGPSFAGLQARGRPAPQPPELLRLAGGSVLRLAPPPFSGRGRRWPAALDVAWPLDFAEEPVRRPSVERRLPLQPLNPPFGFAHSPHLLMRRDLPVEKASASAPRSSRPPRPRPPAPAAPAATPRTLPEPLLQPSPRGGLRHPRRPHLPCPVEPREPRPRTSTRRPCRSSRCSSSTHEWEERNSSPLLPDRSDHGSRPSAPPPTAPRRSAPPTARAVGRSGRSGRS